MKKLAVTAFASASVASAALAFAAYGKMRYHQSPSSFLLEKTMRAVGYRDRIRVDDPENFLASFQQAPDTDTFPTRLLRVNDLHEYEVEGMQVFDWNRTNEHRTVIIYLHGGGYVSRASRLHYLMIHRIARESRSRVVFPIYGLGPRHTIDTQLPRLLALYRNLVEEVGEDNLVLMGDSAGGGLVFSIIQSLEAAQLPMPRQVIALSPWVNLAMDHPQTPFYDAVEPMLSLAGAHRAAQCWPAPGMTVSHPLVSPAKLSSDAVRGFPRTTIFVGSHEMLYPDIRDFHTTLTNGGVDATLVVEPRMIHVYPIFPTTEGRKALQHIVTLITPTGVEDTPTNNLTE